MEPTYEIAMTDSFNHWVCESFEFLGSYGLKTTCEDPGRVEMRSKDATLVASYSVRDGFGISLLSNELKVSLYLLVAAIETHENPSPLSGPLVDEISPVWLRSEIQKIAAFFRDHIGKLINPDAHLACDLAKLRFWHAGPWVNLWGTNIKMSADEIIEERKLVPRIVEALKA